MALGWPHVEWWARARGRSVSSACAASSSESWHIFLLNSLCKFFRSRATWVYDIFSLFAFSSLRAAPITFIWHPPLTPTPSCCGARLFRAALVLLRWIVFHHTETSMSGAFVGRASGVSPFSAGFFTSGVKRPPVSARLSQHGKPPSTRSSPSSSKELLASPASPSMNRPLKSPLM